MPIELLIILFVYTGLVLDLEPPMFLHWCCHEPSWIAASANSTSRIHHLAYLLGLIGQEACDLPQHLYQRTPHFPCSHRVRLAIIQWRLMMWEEAGSMPGSVTDSPPTHWCRWTARRAGGPHSSRIAHQSLHLHQGGYLGNGLVSAGHPLKTYRPRALYIGNCTHLGCRPCCKNPS